MKPPKVLWQVQVGRTTYRARIVVEGDRVLVPSNGESWDSTDDPLDGLWVVRAKDGAVEQQLVPPGGGERDVNGVTVTAQGWLVGTDQGAVHLFSREGPVLWSHETGRNVGFRSHETAGDVEGPPAAADVNGDGVVDLGVGVEQGAFVVLNGVDGTLLYEWDAWGRAMVMSGRGNPFAQAVTWDVDGDGTQDWIFGTRWSHTLHAVNGADGKELWSHVGPSAYKVTPLVADVDGDGDVELLAVSGRSLTVTDGGEVLERHGVEVITIERTLPVTFVPPEPRDQELWLLARRGSSERGGRLLPSERSSRMDLEPGRWKLTAFDRTSSVDLEIDVVSGMEPVPLPRPTLERVLNVRLLGTNGLPLAQQQVRVRVGTFSVFAWDSQPLEYGSTTDLAGRLSVPVPHADRRNVLIVGEEIGSGGFDETSAPFALPAGDNGNVVVPSYPPPPRSMGVDVSPSLWGLRVSKRTCYPEESWISGGDVLVEACGEPLVGRTEEDVFSMLSQGGSCEAIAIRPDGGQRNGQLPLPWTAREVLHETAPEEFRCGAPLDAEVVARYTARVVMRAGEGAPVTSAAKPTVRFVSWYPNRKVAASALEPRALTWSTEDQKLAAALEGVPAGSLVRVWIGDGVRLLMTDVEVVAVGD